MIPIAHHLTYRDPSPREALYGAAKVARVVKIGRLTIGYIVACASSLGDGRGYQFVSPHGYSTPIFPTVQAVVNEIEEFS